MERRLGPGGKLEDAAEGTIEVGRFLGEMPRLLTRGAGLLDRLDMMARNGLVLAPETIADIGRSQARRNRWIALALWMIAGLLGWISYILLR